MYKKYSARDSGSKRLKLVCSRYCKPTTKRSAEINIISKLPVRFSLPFFGASCERWKKNRTRARKREIERGTGSNYTLDFMRYFIWFNLRCDVISFYFRNCQANCREILYYNVCPVWLREMCVQINQIPPKNRMSVFPSLPFSSLRQEGRLNRFPM